MILDIIIPQYKEGEAEIRNLLQSIDTQIGVNKNDFQVTILNDCSDKKLSSEFLHTFNLNINYLQLNINVGPGMTRQFGLDNTSAPYVMFCDADDQLYKSDVLMTIFSALRDPNLQNDEWSFICTNFYEENLQQGYQLIKHEGFNMIFMHGKIFNRAYLNKYNIRFRPDLRAFEDTYFCKTSSLSGPSGNAKVLDLYSYVWKRAPGSISSTWNHDGKSYLFWRADEYIGCNAGAIEFFRKFDPPIERISELVYHTLVYTYFILQSSDFAGADELTIEKKTKLINMCKDIIKNDAAAIKKITPALKKEVYESCEKQQKEARAQLAEFRQDYNDFMTNTLEVPKSIKKYLLYTPEPAPAPQPSTESTTK